MPTVICVANMKGGVGKTTLCVSLGLDLLIQGHNVLVVDNDPQFNATSSLVKPQEYIDQCIKGTSQRTIYDIYERPPRVRGAARRELPPAQFFWRRWQVKSLEKVLDLLPSRIELYETLRNPSQKEYMLDNFLKRHATKYDYILIDCPPTPSVLTLSAFAASDYVLVPVTPDYFATLGLAQFIGTLKDFKADMQDPHDVKLLGAVFSRVERRPGTFTQRAISGVKDVLDELEVDVFDARLSKLRIFEQALWKSAPVHTIVGRGTRGRSEAMVELRAIANEMKTRIAAI